MTKQTSRYSIQEDKIVFTNSEIVFDFPIQDAIEIEDMLIIYIDLNDKVISLEENVFGISISDEEVKWQIEKRGYPTRYKPESKCGFVGINYHDNKLHLFNWCNKALIVEPKTGKVLEEYETR